MNIYLHPPQPSLGLQRIADALRRYAPLGVEVVDDEQWADLVVLYAIGRVDKLTKQAKELEAAGKRYAVMQACLRSTQKPDTYHWWHLWRWAKCVWSYYDLPRAIDEDGGDGDVFRNLGNFYHAPLGADAGVFYPRGPFYDLVLSPNGSRVGPNDRYTIVTSGLSRLSESVRECWLATVQTRGISAHIGASGTMRDCTHSYHSLSDEGLAKLYSRSAFVSALRRKEGFELPGVEGLLCGARPICFDTPDYRHWYDGFAEFIQETDRQGVVDQLVTLFKRGARPVTDEERQRAVARFNWETIIKGFYERIL